MLGQHRADVGVVVLHADRRHAQARGGGERDAGGVEVRMQVVGDGAHWPCGSREQGLHRRFDVGAGVRVVEVAEVGAEGPAVRVEQAGRVLEPGAEGEDGQGVRMLAAGRKVHLCARDLRVVSRRVSSQASHWSSPSPLVAEVWITCRRGFTRSA